MGAAQTEDFRGLAFIPAPVVAAAEAERSRLEGEVVMAITPEKALGNKRQVEAQKVAELEKKIDEMLVARFDGRSSCTMDTKGYDAFVITEVIKRFSSAGWIVNYVGDQCDGDYLEFKPKHLLRAVNS